MLVWDDMTSGNFDIYPFRSILTFDESDMLESLRHETGVILQKEATNHQPAFSLRFDLVLGHKAGIFQYWTITQGQI